MLVEHGFRLLGLASMNIFVALALSAAYLSSHGTRQQMLTEDNVTGFIQDVSSITAGQRGDMDQFTITTFFMDHVAEDGAFKSTVRSSIPGMEERSVSMDKQAFIADVLQDMHQKGKHQAAIKIEDIKIIDNGRIATAVTTSTEKGTMQITASDGGPASLAPINAVSYCQQTVSLGNNHMIQMLSAVCTTDVALADSF